MRTLRGSAAFVLIAVLSGTAQSAAAEPTIDRVDLSAPESEVAAQRDRWTARIAEARAAAVDAHLRHVEAMDAYRFMRHRNRDRGDERTVIMKELSDAEAGLVVAIAELNEMLDSARRAGVPPGWMPDRTDPPAAPSAASDAR